MEGELHADGQSHGYAFRRNRVGHPTLTPPQAWAAGDATEFGPTMSTASARRLRSGVRVSDTSASACGPVSDVSASLSGPVPHDAGVMAPVSGVRLLCPVSVWVVPDLCRGGDGVSDTSLGTAPDICRPAWPIWGQCRTSARCRDRCLVAGGSGGCVAL